MKNKLLVAIIILMLFSLAKGAGAKDITTVEVTPNSFEVKQGDVFSVEIFVDLDQIINAFATDDIRWDPSMVSLNGKPQRGDLFEDSTIWIGGKEIDHEKGIMKFTVWGSQKPTEAAGVFARLNFTALKDGLFELYIHPDYARGAYTEAGGESISIIPQILGNPNMPEMSEEEHATGKTALGEDYLTIILVIVAAALVSSLIIMLVRKKRSKKECKETAEITKDESVEENNPEKDAKNEMKEDKKKRIKYQRAKS